jgi:hypothetical protein
MANTSHERRLSNSCYAAGKRRWCSRMSRVLNNEVFSSVLLEQYMRSLETAIRADWIDDRPNY